jgi:hypothetical protein
MIYFLSFFLTRMMFVLFKNQFWNSFGHVFQIPNLTLVSDATGKLVFQYTCMPFFGMWSIFSPTLFVSISATDFVQNF